MRVYLLLISILFYFNLYASDSICRKSEGVEIHSVNTHENTRLVLCGFKEEDYLIDFRVIHVNEKTKKVVFKSDPEIKKYKVKKLDTSFELDEAINGRYSSPFIKMKIYCDKNKCSAKDTGCIKKNHQITEKLFEKLSKAIGNEDKFEYLDSYVESTFYLALMGNKKARLLIKNEFNGLSMMNTDVAQIYRTIGEDIKRLERINCW
jgi:hypothetical protein